MRHYDIPNRILRDIVRRAIEEGFLFELLFTETGKRLWERIPEKQMKCLIQEELRRKKDD